MAESSISVHLPSLRAAQCTPDIHKDLEASNNIPQVPRSQDSGVSGRHAGFGANKGAIGQVEGDHFGSPREPRVPDQLREVRVGTISDNEILRIRSEHNYHAITPPQGEGCTDSEGGSDPPPNEQGHSKATSTPHWPVHLHTTSDPPCSTTLSGTAGFETRHPEKEWFRHVSSPDRRSQGGSRMVDSEPPPGEWQGVSSGAAFDGYGDRCIPSRVGGSMSRPDNRRPLDNRGETPPHQLPRALGSQVRSPGLCQGQAECGDTTPPRQYDSHSVHKPYGRNKINHALFNGEGSLGLVSSEAHFPGGIAHTRKDQCRSGPSVKDCDRPSRLAAESHGIPGAEFPVGPARSGPICHQNHQAGDQVLQLETRPVGRSHRCLQTE